MPNVYKRMVRTQNQLRVRKKTEGRTPRTVLSSIPDRLTISEMTGWATRSLHQSMTTTIDRTELSKGDLAGCKRILAALGGFACKVFGESQDSGGIPFTPSATISILFSSDGTKSPVSRAVVGENRGQYCGCLKTARLQEMRNLQGTDYASLQEVAT